MRSHRTAALRSALKRLPLEVRRQAMATYERWKADPFDTDLHFKKVAGKRGVYSIRIGLHWRAVCFRDQDTMVWFWIGSHAEYDNPLRRL